MPRLRLVPPALALAVLALVAAVAAVPSARAQQKIGYVDAEKVLQRMPEYAGVQQTLERQQTEWQGEIQRRRQEVDRLFRDYQARELLYTQEERQRRRDEIARAEQEADQLRGRYFGPEGELFTQQQALMKPLQERVLAAVEAVAGRENFDYVFDRTGDFLFLFARPQHDLTDRVLRELGIRDERTDGAARTGDN